MVDVLLSKMYGLISPELISSLVKFLKNGVLNNCMNFISFFKLKKILNDYCTNVNIRSNNNFGSRRQDGEHDFMAH